MEKNCFSLLLLLVPAYYFYFQLLLLILIQFPLPTLLCSLLSNNLCLLTLYWVLRSIRGARSSHYLPKITRYYLAEGPKTHVVVTTLGFGNVCMYVCLFVCSFVRLFVCSFVCMYICMFASSRYGSLFHLISPC